MPKQGVLHIVLILALAAVMAVGCSPKPVQSPTEPAQQPTTETQATAVPKATQAAPTAKPAETTAAPTEAATQAAGGGDLSFSDVSNLAKFKSYRLSNKVSVQEEKGTKTNADFLVEFVADPRAQRMVITGLDTSGKNQTMEMIQIGDVSYVNFDGKWMSMTAADQSQQQLGWMWNPGDFLNAGKGKFIGNETVNGMETKHYRYDYTAFNAAASLSDLKEGQADVWALPEDNVYVKVVMHIAGNDKDKGLVTVDLETNVTDINAPITIKAPEGVEKPGLPDDIPMVEGATEVNFVGSTGSFKTDMAVDQVVDFFKTQMQAKGWTLDANSSAEMLVFTKDKRGATIMVASESGKTSVSIFVTETPEEPAAGNTPAADENPPAEEPTEAPEATEAPAQ